MTFIEISLSRGILRGKEKSTDSGIDGGLTLYHGILHDDYGNPSGRGLSYQARPNVLRQSRVLSRSEEAQRDCIPDRIPAESGPDQCFVLEGPCPARDALPAWLHGETLPLRAWSRPTSQR